MNWTANKIEKVAEAIRRKWGCTTDYEMLRAFAAERRIIEGPHAAIDTIVLRYIKVGEQEHDSGHFAQGLVLELLSLARTLAAALEQERATPDPRATVENVELRTVFECARRALIYNDDSPDGSVIFQRYMKALNAACEAVKLRDSGLADGPMSDAEWSELTKGMREDETINAATQGNQMPDTDGHGISEETHSATAGMNGHREVSHLGLPPAVAAPDQEGLDEAISHLTHVRDLVKDTQPKWANSLTTVLAALRNSAKPAAEVLGPNEYGIVYVYFQPARRNEAGVAHRTVAINNVKAILDYDSDGKLFGIELLNVPSNNRSDK